MATCWLEIFESLDNEFETIKNKPKECGNDEFWDIIIDLIINRDDKTFTRWSS